MNDRVRTRTYQWEEPEAGKPGLAQRSGMEMFEMLRDNKLPQQPIAATIGWTIEAVEKGFIRLRIEPGDYLFHGGGVLHGGVIATLLDSAMASSVLTMLERGTGATTLQITVNTMRGVKRGVGPLFAEGRVDHLARKAAAASAVLLDGDGKVYAKAMSSMVVLDQTPGLAKQGVA